MRKMQCNRSALWLLMLVVAVFVGCSEGNFDPYSGDKGTPFDASKPTVVSDFLPKSAGANARLVLYGQNFGNDTTRVKVTIGGLPSKVIAAKGESILCMVPSKAFDGDIVVSVLDENGNVVQTAECENRLEYQRRTLVSDLLGQTTENNTKYDVKDGPFNDCGGMERLLWLKIDPMNPDMMYSAGDDKSTRTFDLENKYVGTFSETIDRVSSVNFTLKGDMILTRDQTSDTQTGLYLYTRESGFKTSMELCNGRGVKVSDTHPVNGRVYYTLYRKGQIWSVDPYNPVDNRFEVGLPRTGTGVLMVWHPEGKYCYLLHCDRNTIWRSDYNEATGEMSNCYLVCGKDATTGWVDGVGANARLKKPYQGVFVKNSEYAGQEDEYDFYFTDNGNHCVRVLTPMGRVYTYAGHTTTDGKNYNGSRNGELRTEAQFYYPEAIAYDAKRKCFYVGDTNNRKIRRIGEEQ